ncbi:TcmI family type II polyketide cyclase [Saccharomonospora piscinae]|uniref:TcmI family type II polyketide cyclase n=1 Tax=Saccharomonospora piscinae TaxID=687388 RepID=UPI000464D9BD|nr:TcmI family type II polyketide cyclase [Saccharomonospora piscinae]
MAHTLIVARMSAGSERAVAGLFGESDAGGLPHRIGVRARTLFHFHDLYFHLIESEEDIEGRVRAARDDPDFRALSRKLDAHISPYDPDTWRGPFDAMATPFYAWTAPGRPCPHLA